MKFKGVTPHFRCAMADAKGHVCSNERARWPGNGYWADVCQKAMDTWLSNVAKTMRNPWTGKLKEK
jgi:hypothetical protein